jgi:hypothetical protein
VSQSLSEAKTIHGAYRLTSWRQAVPKEGLEPSHPKAQEPKSCVSTSSTTPAHDSLITDLSESQHEIRCSDSDKSALARDPEVYR